MNGLFYFSVPASAGAPYGNCVVSVDPETGALGTPIPVGSDPDLLAVSSDGSSPLGVTGRGFCSAAQVNLATGTAGIQIPLGGNSGLYNSPQVATALTALPGFPNSVVIAYNAGVGIYDNGVLRGSEWTEPSNAVYALLANGTKSEIYAAGSTFANTGYNTFTYNASGLTFLATAPVVENFANYGAEEIQIAGGTLYTDYGQAFNAETGALLGSLDAAGTTVTNGPIFADTTLGLAFILDNAQGAAYGVGNAKLHPDSDLQSLQLPSHGLSDTSGAAAR